MFCPDCGNFVDVNAQFCNHCGTKFVRVEVHVPIDVAVKVKSFISSKLMLILCIVFTLSTVLSIAYGSFNTDDILTDVIREYNSIGTLERIDVTVSQGLGLCLNVIANIPTVLTVIALWMTCTDARRDKCRFTGISMLKGLSVFYLVMICIVAVIGGVVILTVCFAMTVAEPLLAGFTVVIGLFTIAVPVLFIVFYAKVISTLNAVTETLTAGRPSDRISVFAAVICFIIGAPLCLSVFAVFTTPVSSLVNLLSAASYIIFGMLILNYRNMIREILFAPAYNGSVTYVNHENNNNY